MKKFIFILILSFLFLASQAIGQQTLGGVAGKGIDMQTGLHGFVTQIAPPPAEVIGDVYHDSEFVSTDIVLFSETQKNTAIPSRLNLQTNDLEIKYNGELKSLPGRFIKEFYTHTNSGKTERFVNARKYKFDNSALDGFLLQIDSGNWSLYSLQNVRFVKANYVAAIDAGEKRDKFVKEERHFFCLGSNLFLVFPSVKKFVDQFGKHSEEIRSFIKTNDISLKNEIDLLRLLNFLNTEIKE